MTILTGGLIKKLKAERRYKGTVLEKEAFRTQRYYTGLAPAIPTPSIHNLPRLAPKEEKQESNNGLNLNQAA